MIVDAGKVYDRLKEFQGLESDTALAKFFGLKSPQVLSNWRLRGSVQLDHILTKFPRVDLNWLFRGVRLDAKDRKEVEAAKARRARPKG